MRNKAGLNVIDIVLEPLASAQAVLAADERDLGVCMIDIGGGTTDIAVFADGSIKNTAVLGLGGYHLTNDIAVGLRTPFEEAERIKKNFGVASARYLSSDDVLTVPSVGGRRPREISRKILCEIIEPRAEEILSLARQEIIQGGPRRSDSVGRRAHRWRLGTRRASRSSRRRSSSRRCAWAYPDQHRRAAGRREEPHVRDRCRAGDCSASRSGAPAIADRFRIRDESIFGRVKQRMRDWFYAEFD